MTNTIEHNLITALTDFTLHMETYSYKQRDYIEEDQMSYARLIIVKAVMDKTYYLLYGGDSTLEEFAYDSKERARKAVKRAKSGEIGYNVARKAMCKSHSASAKHECLKSMFEELQTYYTEWQGEPYLPYGADKSFLIGNAEAKPMNVPSDVEQQLNAMEASLNS
tara:strand:+ start:867 stop:1361 length:495 start_codon:yes stop_codon:yes gene_type:complete